jgi:hypothetical protein
VSGLFAFLGKGAATVPAAAAGINLNTSVYGRPVPLVYGVTRVGGNMLLYGNFNATQQGGAGSGGGKGGLFGAPQQSGGGYVYNATFAFALSEGPIQGVNTIWKDNQLHTLADLGFLLFTGTFPQSPWAEAISWSFVNTAGSTISGSVQTQLDYNGIAYAANPNFFLGSNASVPNLQFEVQGLLSTSFSGSTVTLTDADRTY